MVLGKTKASVLSLPFQGKWSIAEMDLWDNDALDLGEPAFVDISGDEGEMRFIAVHVWLDIRYTAHSGSPRAEFSWEEVDNRDPRSGRGWLEVGTAGRLNEKFYFHVGDGQGLSVSRGECALTLTRHGIMQI